MRYKYTSTGIHLAAKNTDNYDVQKADLIKLEHKL